MPNWFLGTIQYSQPIDDAHVGTKSESFIKQKNVTETYLFDAVSYTDAEGRVYLNIAANTPEFEVKNIARMKLADIITTELSDGVLDGETWFKVKALFIMDDEKTGKQKKVPSLMLANAANPKQAYERVEAALKSSLDPFEITDVNITKILEIFPYDEHENRSLTPLAEAIGNLAADGVSVSISNAKGEVVPWVD